MKQTRIRSYYAFLFILAVSSSLIATNNQYSRKTFMATRSVGINLPMEYTTWHEHVYPSSNPRHHSHIQATGFFQGSSNKADTGKYFGIGNGTNSFSIGTNDDVLNHTADLENRFLIHSFDPADVSLADTITLRPRQHAWGVRFDYMQDINHPICGLFFKMSLPFAWVDRKLQDKKQLPATLSAGGFSAHDFFAGNVNVNATTSPENQQLPLAKAKIDGRRQKGGLADIDLALGYKCVDNEMYHAHVNIGITIPTGNRVRGEYLFEPVYGNGRHFGLGAGVDMGWQVWCNDKAQIKAMFAANYRYLFQGTEARTVALKSLPFSHYFLAAKDQQTNVPLFPAANVLTQDLAVKPGSQLDTLVALSFMCSNFVIDAGYNMFWKDKESAWVKNWTDNVYGIAQKDFNASNAFDIDPAAGDVFIVLNRSEFDTTSFVTPTIFTHKLFGALGYSTSIFGCYPCGFGVGASYEFATTNADLEQYAVWGKISLSF